MRRVGEKEVRQLVRMTNPAHAGKSFRRITASEWMPVKVGLDGVKKPAARPGRQRHRDRFRKRKRNRFWPPTRLPSDAARGRSQSRREDWPDLFWAGRSFQRDWESVDQWVLSVCGCWRRFPKNDFLLEGVTRVGVKMLSMPFRPAQWFGSAGDGQLHDLGRPSNLKLIDRSHDTSESSREWIIPPQNCCSSRSIEYVEPRMKADQSYPPVVGLSVMRSRHQIVE